MVCPKTLRHDLSGAAAFGGCILQRFFGGRGVFWGGSFESKGEVKKKSIVCVPSPQWCVIPISPSFLPSTHLQQQRARGARKDREVNILFFFVHPLLALSTPCLCARDASDCETLLRWNPYGRTNRLTLFLSLHSRGHHRNSAQPVIIHHSRNSKPPGDTEHTPKRRRHFKKQPITPTGTGGHLARPSRLEQKGKKNITFLLTFIIE